MIYLYLMIIIFATNLIAKLVSDLIKFKRLPKGDWWLAEGKYSYDKRTIWTKGMFSFVSDGWHFMDAIRNLTFIIPIVFFLGLTWYWCIIGYAIYGLLFNISYKIL